ncbi:MAG: radical SAM protein [bacterium]
MTLAKNDKSKSQANSYNCLEIEPGKVDALIINPPAYLHREFVDYPFFTNLGILQSASVLLEAGISVRVVDALSLPGGELAGADETHFRFGATATEIFDEIADCEPRIIAIAKTVFNYSSGANPYIKELLAGLKARFPDAPLALCDFYFGGMHYIDEPEDIILKKYPEADFILKYECEAILSELAALLLDGNVAREKMQKAWKGLSAGIDLDRIPAPRWDLIHVEQYQKNLRSVFERERQPSLFEPTPNTFPAIASRGCVYECVFCTKNPGQPGKDKRNYRLVPLEKLKAHFEELKEKHNARKIIILDGLVNHKESHFAGLIGILNGLDLKYDFPNGLRADRLKRRHLESLAGRVGTLSISAESGSQAVVDGIVVKKQSLKSVERVARWCRELKITLLIHYIIGLFGEGIADVNETLRHALRMKREFGAESSVQFAVPLPGAPLYDLCVSKRLLPEEPIENYAPYFSEKPMIGAIALPPATLAKMRERFEIRKSVTNTRKVIINLTYECSNSCRFCAIGRREKSAMTFDKATGFLKHYRADGVRMADFDGGEPTLHPDLLEIIGAAREMGYEKINVTTNGRLLASRDLTARLLLCGITDLLISIHGHDAEIHDFHTMRPGSFEETIQGLRNATRLKPDRIDLGVNTTLTNVNAQHLSEFTKMLVGEGVKKLNVQFVTPFGSVEKEIVPNPASAAAHLRLAIDRYSDKIRIQAINLPFCFMEGYEEYLAGDIHKNERNMVFVSEENVNLAEWLAAGRRRGERCGDCEFAIVCDGEFQFEEIGI